jgi:hypothetical protein
MGNFNVQLERFNGTVDNYGSRVWGAERFAADCMEILATEPWEHLGSDHTFASARVWDMDNRIVVATAEIVW